MNPNTTTALETRPQAFVVQSEPSVYDRISDPIKAAEALGNWIALSNMFGCEKKEAGMVLAFHCLVLRKDPIQVCAAYHIIDGKLSKKAAQCLAELRKMGAKHKWITEANDPLKATLQVVFEGETSVVTYTIEMAKQQGLIKHGGAWTKNPWDMLQARAITSMVKRVAPEVMVSIASEGEEEAPPAQAKPSNVKPLFATMTAEPAQAAAMTQTAKPVEQKVIDVPGQSVAAQPAAGAENQQTTPAAPAFTATLDPSGKLNMETVEKLQEAITEPFAEKALAWFVQKGKLKTGELINSLNIRTAQEIINRPAGFRSLLEKL